MKRLTWKRASCGGRGESGHLDSRVDLRYFQERSFIYPNVVAVVGDRIVAEVLQGLAHRSCLEGINDMGTSESKRHRERNNTTN